MHHRPFVLAALIALAVVVPIVASGPLARAQDAGSSTPPVGAVAPAGVISASGAVTGSAGVTTSSSITAAAAVPDLAVARAADAGIVTRTLGNGLQVIVWPDHDIPNVALYTFFRVGSRNEQVGRTGLAHFFEHMMFNGSKNFPPGEFDRQMEDHGGSNNAYTSEDVTVYQDWVPRAALDLTLRMEGDRIGALSLDEAKVQSERDVIISERAGSVDDDAMGYLWEQTDATAFLAHPYENPVIGWPSDIARWTADDIRAFFRTYYAPNNATLVAVGDVAPDEVFALAEKHYGAIPSQPPGLEMRTIEPEQSGERRLVVRRVAQAPQILMAFHSGRPTDPDWPAMEILTAIVADGDSSRLYRRLVEEESAAVDVGVYLDSGFDPKLTWLWATLPPDGDVAAVEAMIGEELDRVASEGVTGAELAKAGRMKIAGYWRDMQTISGKAEVLGNYQVFHGDWRLLFAAPERYEAVTAAQVQGLAARVFPTTNRTVGILEPLAEPAEEVTP
jgi:zinc protease